MTWDRPRASHSESFEARFDRQLRNSLSDVPVPPGLHGRVLASLDQARADENRSGARLMPSFSRGRRQFLRGGVALSLATAAGLLGLWLFYGPTAQPAGADAILAIARDWISTHSDSIARTGVGPQSARYRPPNEVFTELIVGWQRLPAGFVDRAGYVFRLATGDGAQAFLLVVDLKSARSAPLAALPTVPLQSVVATQGTTAATWTDGQRLFVLVTQSDLRGFQRFLRPTNGVA